MNTMANALKSAGVHLPSQRQRIWTWLQSNPDASAADVKKVMNMPQASTLLAQLFYGGGVDRREVFDARAKRAVLRYRVVGERYEPPKAATRKAATRKVPDARAQDIQTHVRLSARQPVDLETLTLGELRAIYKQLSHLFKE